MESKITKMKSQTIIQHIATHKSALADLYVIAEADAFVRDFGKNKDVEEKTNKVLDSYAKKIASLMPDNFPESNAKDITDTAEGKAAIDMVNNIAKMFGAVKTI